MNLQKILNILGIAEKKVIMATRNRIVSSQNCKPIIGVVQDALNGAYILTYFDTMVPWAVACDCYTSSGLESRVQDMLRRALPFYPKYIRKEKGLYQVVEKQIPGKLFLSIVFLPDFEYRKKTNAHSKNVEVLIEDGIILPNSGPIDSSVIGIKSGSVVHILANEYDTQKAADFVTDVHFLIDYWFPTYGFSIGISDCQSTASEMVSKVLLEAEMKCSAIIARKDISNKEKEGLINQELINCSMVSTTIADKHMNKGDRNAFNIMRRTGSKGNVANITSVVAFVGQQNISGQRMTKFLTGETRTSYEFKPGDMSPAAGGFVSSSYFKGLNPSEQFAHAGAGRKGGIDTSIKSVTWETEIIVNQKKVRIGEWIDLLMKNNERVRIDEDNVECLDLNFFCEVPTIDLEGNESMGQITAVTRHDPGSNLYQIKTKNGKEVTVTESKSLLIWNSELNIFERRYTNTISIGDCLPLSSSQGSGMKVRDVVLDPIIEINRIDPKKHPKMYDLTVPSTIHFGLANGLYVVDTAETGYAEKKMTKKMEHFSVALDGTVRDHQGAILSFLHCDNGMDPKKLFFISSHPKPFFCDPERIALTLTQIERRKKKNVVVRKMNEDELEMMCSFLNINKEIDSPVIRNANFHLHRVLKQLCSSILLAESCIPSFCRKIMEMFGKAICPYGEMVGIIASLSIGEPVSQATLNSVVPETKLMIRDSGEIKVVEIGPWVDSLMKENSEKIKHFAKNKTEYLELDDPIEILSPDSKGNVKWSSLTAVTRHLPPDEIMYEVKTLSGRQVTVTQEKSLLVWNGSSFVHANIDQIDLGDLVPIFSTEEGFERINDVILDPIVSIKEVPSSEFVYDVTVPSTLNFCTFEGLGIADTFHATGRSEKDVTMGVPRIVELCNATDKMATPSCSVYLSSPEMKKYIKLSSESKDSKMIEKYRSKCVDLLQERKGEIECVTINMLLLKKKIFAVKDSRVESSPIKLMNYAEYQPEWWVELSSELNNTEYEADHWVIRLEFDMKKLLERNIKLEEIVEAIELNEGDSFRCAASPLNMGTIDVFSDYENLKNLVLKKLDTREGIITEKNLTFFAARDVAIPKLEKIKISGIKKIEKVHFVEEKKTKEWYISTKGTNLPELLTRSWIDATKTISNDMREICRTLGIEAARTFIIREFTRVISFDGTYIHPVHITMLADSMVKSGDITSVRREGIERAVGPYAKGLFEQSVANFTLSSILGESDNITGVSACVAMGHLIKGGTGAVKLVTNT